ncbi:hypothetical protein [uncultured Helicobacter sp.]|uniref:hypothetical protein n=1 Tax=uncultured Helicobacter sp. TaxID=175537 RepID=UPI002595E756|nr:hypothetical protein [uncultured Helicobacter sp.]
MSEVVSEDSILESKTHFLDCHAKFENFARNDALPHHALSVSEESSKNLIQNLK